MAIWSTVNLRESINENRLDAEFFQPEYLDNDVVLKQQATSSLGELCRDIRYGLNVPPDYSEDGLPFIRALNLKEGGIEGEVLRIPFEPEEVGGVNLLSEGDILIVRSGANVGDVGVITEAQEGWTFGSYVIRCRVCNVDPFFLHVFLLSRPGRLQTVRYRSGAAQPNISIPNLRQITVPHLSQHLQKQVRNVFDQSLASRRKATHLLGEAERILNTALGLDGLDLAPRLFYEDTFAHAAEAGRVDAEYFSPRMQNLIEALSTGGQNIGDVGPLAKRRFKPTPGKSFEYIEIADIATSGAAKSKSVSGEDAPSRATWIVKAGDIITTTVRPIRRLSAIISPEQDGFVCSSGFAVLRPRGINPELLLTYLRLPLVAELLDLHTTASMYPAISTTDLLRIPISLPEAKVRAEIVAKVRESFAARHEAQRLLDEAKAMVEDAILEQG